MPQIIRDKPVNKVWVVQGGLPAGGKLARQRSFGSCGEHLRRRVGSTERGESEKRVNS